MRNKYKVGLLRLHLLLAAVPPAVMAAGTADPTETLLLLMAVGWLVVSALLVELSHRRPALVPWQLLPSLLLAGLLLTAPERFHLWLWAWAALVMLPQPAWMVGFNMGLAGLAWGWLSRDMPVEQAALSAAVLVLMLLAGVVHLRERPALRGTPRQRVHLLPEMRLWPRSQLYHDLERERARAQRDGTYAELLLLDTGRWHFWPRARQLCALTYRFEHCYRLDGATLGALLLHRSAEQAMQRRSELLHRLGPIHRQYAMSLSELGSIDEACRALASADRGAPT